MYVQFFLGGLYCGLQLLYLAFGPAHQFIQKFHIELALTADHFDSLILIIGQLPLLLRQPHDRQMMLCFRKLHRFLILRRHNILARRHADFGKLIPHDPVHNPIQLLDSVAGLSIALSRMAHVIVAPVPGTDMVVDDAPVLADAVPAAGG